MREPPPAPGITPERSRAAWLLHCEGADAADFDATLAAAERVCQKLSLRVARLVTAEGSQALLARALHLAAAEAPFLQGVRAGAVPGLCLVGVREQTGSATPDQVLNGLVAVVAHLVGLLTLFIGEPLSGNLIHDVWPDAPGHIGEVASAPEEAQS